MKVGVVATSIEPLIGLTMGAAAGHPAGTVVVVDEDEVDDVDEELDVELEVELEVEEVLVEVDVVVGIVVVVADSTLRVTGTNSVVSGALLSTMSSAV